MQVWGQRWNAQSDKGAAAHRDPPLNSMEQIFEEYQSIYNT